MASLEHWAKFKPDERLLREFDHWIVVARPKQITFGASVFLLKRPAPTLGSLNVDELAELAKVAQWFETTLTEKLGAEKFNYIAAMMKDPYFHFHAIPRYSQPVSVAGIEWPDEDWPAVATFRDVDTSDAVLAEVIKLLRG